MPTNKKFNARSKVPAAVFSETSRPRVALMIETSTFFGRRLMQGITQYMRENGRWSIYFIERGLNEPMPSWLLKWHGDGVISRLPSPEIREMVGKLHIPVVDLNEQMDGMGMPMISNDHAAIGRMAAQHLLDRGFQQFAFVGHFGCSWSDGRQKTFVETVNAAGYPCRLYPGTIDSLRTLREGSWQADLDCIAEWAAALPKPVGIMACNDFRALQLLNACKLANVAVPERAAVIGVGADDIVCELADPPLSSVVLNAWRTGYEAAALLAKLMRGEALPPDNLAIPPLSVAVRRSTEITAIADPLVAEAIRFIREHVCDGINVETVMQKMGVSRTSLQNHFRSAIHQSIHDVLIDMRMTHVKELLAETTLSIESIADRCGFSYPEYMSSIFKQKEGKTPAGYRREFGKKDKFI